MGRNLRIVGRRFIDPVADRREPTIAFTIVVDPADHLAGEVSGGPERIRRASSSDSTRICRCSSSTDCRLHPVMRPMFICAGISAALSSNSAS